MACKNLSKHLWRDPADPSPVLGNLGRTDCLTRCCSSARLVHVSHVLGLRVASRVGWVHTLVLPADNPVKQAALWRCLALQTPQQCPDAHHLSVVVYLRGVVIAVPIPDEAVSELIRSRQYGFNRVLCLWLHGVKKPAGAGWVWGGGELGDREPVFAHDACACHSFTSLDCCLDLGLARRWRLRVGAQRRREYGIWLKFHRFIPLQIQLGGE